jgi:serralysin
MFGSIENSVVTATSTRERQLRVGVKQAAAQLNDWLQGGDRLQQLDLAFGTNWDRSKGSRLLQNWAKGKQLPKVEIVLAAQLNGANGGFDSTSDTIYISQELLDRQGASDSFTAVLLEELGHYFDKAVNTQDSAGDEGAIFSKLVRGQQISSGELASLKQENDRTQVALGGTVRNLELSTTYGNIMVDGSLADWTASERLDSAATGTAQTGYKLYGKYAANNYLFAIESAQNIGAGTTIWLNTDQNRSTGFQVFGYAGGAEYNINFAADGKAYLYSGADGQNYIAPLDYAIAADGKSAEIAVSTTLLGTTAPTAIDILADVNNSVFIPGDYSTTAKLTVSQSGSSTPPFVPKNTYGNITLNGSLTDWTALDRLDYFASQQVAGYSVYGKNTADGYVLAISAAEAIGANTTIWLNTDANKASGFQVFGSTVGAEYNINFAADGKPYLYTGGAGQTLVGQLDFALSADGKTLEVAIPKSSMTVTGNGIQAAIDVNDRTFLPGDYASNSLFVSSTALPTRTDSSKRIAIVHSETSANNYFDKKAYYQLFTAAQSQAFAAGIPFDLLTEDDLKDINKLVNYDALVIPSFTNVKQADLSAIETSLTQAVVKYGIGIVTSGDFMTNSETGAALAGDPYSRMKNLLGIQRTAGGGIVNAVVKAKDVTSGILSSAYTAGEELINYSKGTAFAAYSAVGTGTILAEQTVNGTNYNAVVATRTGGQNVHFANQAIFADSKIVTDAIESIVYKNNTKVSLDLTRNTSLFLSRDDVDESRFADQAPTVQGKLADILTQWKSKYGFVGTHFINIGNDPANGEFTDWNVMRPIYQRWLALGNEIGTHSYTHPNFTSNLTAAEIEFEFNQSKNIISQQLGINVTGMAVPGNPESLRVDQELDKYFQYYTGVGTSYNTAAGFLDPTSKGVYFAPNITFDFSAIGFQKLTNAQTEALWNSEYNQLRNNAHKPIIQFAWHDYGATGSDPLYDPAIFDRFIAKAAADGTEFVTFDDAQNRIRTLDKSKLTVNQVGDVISATATPDGATSGLGKFSLDIQSTKQIKNVTNYYAFDKDSVFLTKAGGSYTINLGTTTDNVTRISALAQRAELLSVTGDGQNLDYSFNGEGKISIDLNVPTGKGFVATGANSYTLTGNRLDLTYNKVATQTGKVAIAATTNLTGGNGNDLLVGGTGNDTLVGVNAANATAGRGEVDTLTNSAGIDRFVLGDSTKVYYNDGIGTNAGLADYAKIVGFTTNTGDIIQLKGKAGDYTLSAAPTSLGSGTAIYNKLFGQAELIGFVENVSGLNINASYFKFV